MPKISVIMPAYNAEKYIAEAIDSILAQTFGDFEFIVLNDHSSDRTEEIILSYQDSRIVYVKNEKNLGVAGTLNRGLEMARGEYIARMDADDISLPERFEKQVAFLDENTSVVVLGAAIEQFGAVPRAKLVFSEIPEQSKAELLFYSCVSHPAVMIRRKTLEENKLCYSLEWEGAEDYALWWELCKYGQIVSLPDCLLHYRIHPKQVSQNSEHRIAIFRQLVDKRMADLGMVLSEEENRLFFAYSSGKIKQEGILERSLLIETFGKILKNNSQKPFFSQKWLRWRLRLAAFSVIETESITKKQARCLRAYAHQNGLSLFWLMLRRKIIEVIR